ncbi:MAG TPA: hypothetical protein VNO50_13375 [Pyrinomonadaceae bacterium]|nr:hypothetical protein [Pyrinomonadaceae bacterium]
MKKITGVLLLGMLLSVLLAPSMVGIQPSYARMDVDCEITRFNATMDASSSYTTAFRSWRYGVPITCLQQCTTSCGGNPTCISGCTPACQNTRYTEYTDAGSALASAGNEPCAYNPDQCAEARARRDQCQATLAGQWENPDYDENNNIDMTWQFYVSGEYMACYAASGMDSCE